MSDRVTPTQDATFAQEMVPAATFLVKVGMIPQIGRFHAPPTGQLTRNQRVVCRTSRGLEVGVIMSQTSRPSGQTDGKILRRLGPEDELLWGHLQQLSQAAHSACLRWLEDNHIEATLLDVEPLLDGRTLYFHFLDSVTAEVEEHLDQLVESYESSVRTSKFAQLLEHGCGPGCGTEKAVNGCGSRGGCAVCKVASACKK